MKKIISISLAITTTLWLVGTIIPIAKVQAAVIDGDIVSPDATFVDADGNTYYPYDVFIVKIIGTKTFKRLVLNPQVFTSYGHLKWSNLKKISAATVKGYTTSALTRAVNDPKVYVLAPNGDVGTKKWVDDIPCFTSKGYDWDSVYEINATDRDNYTTLSSLCGGVGEVTGDISLALASDNPAAATLPLQSQGITFLKVNVTGSGTISQLTIARKGAGQVDDFGDIYVYKNGIRLTAGRALSSATSKVSFINLGIAAPAAFEIVADLTGSPNAGNVNYFAIEAASDVTANATIGGAFPLNGNPMGTSGATAGTLTVDHTGSATRDVTIGAIGAEISQFKLTTATEGAYLSRVKLLNNGDADNDKVTNLVLKDNLGTTLATYASLTTAGYVDFVLSTPYYIKKGESQIFRIYADIGATKPARTIKLYPEITTDILATGNIYGFGMKATLNFASTDLTTVTCKGGDLTLNKIGPNAAKIGTTTYDTNFLEFSMSAAADITIKRTRLVFCEDLAGDGSYNAASVSAGADIEDIKIKDKDSGAVIAGPKDGTAFSDGTYAGCPSAVVGMYEDYTDTIDLTSGTTKTYQVTADIKTSNTDSGMEIVSGSKIKFVLYSYASIATTYGVAAVKYADTSEAVLATAIAPSGDIAGEEMTIGASALTLSLAATPSGSGASAKTYIKGQAGVEAVGIIFTAGNASDVTVSNITLTAYTSEDVLATRVFTAGVDTNYVKDTIGNVYIYDKTTGAMIPGSTAKGFSGGSSSLVEYSGLNWVIPAGEQKTLLVKSDISSASPASASDGTADTFISFDIVSDNVSAIDKDGNTVAPSGYSANLAASPSTYFGVAKFGSLAMVAASDTPDKSIAVMGTTNNEVSKFKLTGTNEAWYIQKFSIVLSDGQADGNNQYANSANTDNFSAVMLKYQTEAQKGTSTWTTTAGKTFGSLASLGFSFSGSDRIYVPKDDNTYVTVLASIATYNGGNGAKSKVPFKMYPITGSTDSFLAYGAQSGEQLYTVIEPASTGFNLVFVARSKPVFAKEAWSGNELELARFSITAVGYDVIFDGTAGSSKFNSSDTAIASADMEFTLLASSTDDALGALTLYDWNDNVVASAASVQWNDTVYSAIVPFSFEVRDVTVPQDTTKTFYLQLSGGDLTDFQKSDEYVYLQLKNDLGGSLATGSMTYGSRNIVYGDGTNEEGISGTGDPELRFGMPALIKNIGPLPVTFRTLRGTGTP